MKKRKILVFAHVPPPHHGQSVMVQALLQGLQDDPRFTVHHVDARVSDDMQDVGLLRLGKILRLFRYVLQAWWIRIRHGRMAFYYVPAPAKRLAIIRDCIVMTLCRPFFPELILHWHAHGLIEWINEKKSLTRLLAQKLLGKAELSIVLSKFQVASVAELNPRTIKIVANGIQDPCHDFETTVLVGRNKRLELRRTDIKESFRLLFLGNCTEAKGIFRVLDALARASSLEKGCGRGGNFLLEIAGSFVSQIERDRFEDIRQKGIFRAADSSPLLHYHGFLSGKEKLQLLRECDALVFPTLYPTEVQPVVLIEAMAHGLPIIATRWRGIPEMFPHDYPFLCEPGDPDNLLACMQRVRDWSGFVALRNLFLHRFSSDVHQCAIADALLGA